MTAISNPFNKAVYELKEIFNHLLKYKTDTEAKVKEAEKATGFADGMNYLPLEKLSLNLQSFDSIRIPTYNRYNKISLEKFEEIVTKQIVDFRTYLLENKPARDFINAHNDSISKSVVDLMAKLGIFTTYVTYEFKTSRDRERTKVAHISGFFTDLSRVRPVDNMQMLTNQLNDYETRFRSYVVAEKQKELKDVELNYQKAVDKYWINDIVLSSKLIEIGINPCVTLSLIEIGINPCVTVSKYKDDADVFSKVFYDINSELKTKLESIRAEDKYLSLGYYLEQNRNDWSDGPDFAEQGLNKFTIDSPVDLQIEECIQNLISNWDGDGRVFRGCEYSHEVLYGMVDKELMTRYEKIVILQTEWNNLK